ncbi:MAG: DUF58 domain-containing protein [Chloroflexota bacterium]
MYNRRNAIYILIILSLLTGLFTGRAFFFNLGYMLIGIVLVSLLWAWMSVRWIGITRRTRSRRAQVGRIFDETFIVRNRAWLPKLWLEVRDESNLPGHRVSYVVPAMGLRSQHVWTVSTRCTARGEFRLGPMTLSSGDPFGLFNSERHLNASSRLIVYPRILRLSHVDLPIGMLSGGEAQRRRSHYVTTNAAGVRDYVPGDSFNRIHWRTSARKDRLIVKEFEIDPLVDIWLFADFSQGSLIEDPAVKRIDGVGPVLSNTSDIPPSTEEYVAVVAASLARYFIGLERALGFAAYTPNREIHQPERGNRQLTRILESLAVARSLSSYSLEQMLTLETPYFTRGTTLVIVTASLDLAWVREAQILMRRGIRPVCVLVDAASIDDQHNTDELKGVLSMSRIPVIVVRHGENIAAALARRPF